MFMHIVHTQRTPPFLAQFGTRTQEEKELLERFFRICNCWNGEPNETFSCVYCQPPAGSYAWSESCDLLKNTVFLGGGGDNSANL